MACLPSAPVGTDSGSGGQACWVAGWGKTDAADQSGSTTLNSVGVNVFSHQYCAQKTAYIPLPDDICAGIPDEDDSGTADGGKDSCQVIIH